MSSWAGGDASAFDALFERWRGRVHGYALRLLRRPELAEEVCMDAFGTVLEGRYQPTGRFRAWLFTTVVHQLLGPVDLEPRATEDLSYERLLTG